MYYITEVGATVPLAWTIYIYDSNGQLDKCPLNTCSVYHGHV